MDIGHQLVSLLKLGSELDHRNELTGNNAASVSRFPPAEASLI